MAAPDDKSAAAGTGPDGTRPTGNTVLTGNIVLTGFMGTGKSTVGRLLADRLGARFVDTDAVIETRHGPIVTIFAERGEEVFRELERAVAAELADETGLVIGTGGRMLLDPVNRAALTRTGVVVCLTASVDTLLDRLLGDGVEHRPLLATPDPGATIAELLAARAAGYGEFPQVGTDGRTPDQVVDAVEAIVAPS